MSRRTVAVVGIHGFAKIHLEHLLRLREVGAFDRLVAVAHQPERDPAWVEDLRRQQVDLVADFEALLQEPDLGLVTLPVAIDLHVPMAEACLDRGIRVYVEKPVAGTVAELDRLAAHPRADLVQVGFQHLALPGVRALRARLALGDFGALRKITVTCGWPRGDRYYRRNPWAGRVVHEGHIIRDSPANNANAHHLNLALHLAGRPVVDVTAHLGRGNPIESFDTCGLRLGLEGGAEVIFNASHLGMANLGVRVRVECERGVITGEDLDGQPHWLTATGEVLTVGGDADRLAYAKAVASAFGGGPVVCTVAEARHHAVVIEAIHQQHQIRDILGCGRLHERWCHPVVDAALLAAHREGRALRLEDLEAGLFFPHVDHRRSA